MTESRRPDLFLDGIGFGEGPRWRHGRLWFSDFLLQHVASVGLGGDLRVEAVLDDRPSGLGWLPDGRLLIVSMTRRQVVRRELDGRIVVHADLSTVIEADANDMVVAADGTAYIGNFGSDLVAGEPPRPAHLAVVRPDGGVSRGAEGLLVPNGSVINPDGDTLIVGESLGRRYRAFPINPDGTLGGGRIWAELGERAPDGCALDADDAIWFADIAGHAVVRVLEGGRVTEVVELPDRAYACALGGARGHTLFILTSPSVPTKGRAPGDGRIWSIEVDVPHAGQP